MSEPSAPSTAAGQKRCCRCGKDVTGKERYKNREGYWCPSCNAIDEAKKGRMPRDGRKRKKKSGKGKMVLVVVGLVLFLGLIYFFVL